MRRAVLWPYDHRHVLPFVGEDRRLTRGPETTKRGDLAAAGIESHDALPVVAALKEQRVELSTLIQASQVDSEVSVGTVDEIA